MNRTSPGLYGSIRRVPRERGDEPPHLFYFSAPHGVFPASAGMNRPGDICEGTISCVPRERGDEPSLNVQVLAGSMCSPRARG